MAILNGETADADEIMNAFGSMFNDTAQNIFNADYIGLDSKLNGDGTLNLKNVFYDTFNSDSMSTYGNAEYNSIDDLYYSFPTAVDTYTSFDEFDDSTVDLTKWTIGGTVTENGAYQQVTCTSNKDVASSTSTSKNLINVGDMIMANYPTLIGICGDYSGHIATVSIKLGTNVLYTFTNSTRDTTETHSNIDIQIIRFTGSYAYRVYEGSWSAWSIIESSEALALISYTYVDNPFDVDWATATARCGYVRYNTSIDLDGSITSTTETTSETVTNAIPIINDSGNTNIISLTADGTNYEIATNHEIHRFANTGTSLKTKIEIAGVGSVSETAIKYNLY